MVGSKRFQNGSLSLVKNKTTDDSWFFRFYEVVDGKRLHRNQRIGTVRDYPRRRDAEKAVLSLRVKINTELRSPETVEQLVAHYRKHELNLDRMTFATVESYDSYLTLHILPHWGACPLAQVKTVAFERWLDSLKKLDSAPFSPASKTKIRNITSAVFSHGIRHEWITFNPITEVRCSAKRQREPDILTPGEFRALLQELNFMLLVAVRLDSTTGFRRCELIALRWRNLDCSKMEVAATQSCVRGRLGKYKKLKTDASANAVPLDPSVFELLMRWREASLYKEDDDFIFPSLRLLGTKPLSPDMLLKQIQKAAIKAGIVGKTIGWHTFRHSFATNLCSLGVGIKVSQELMRHASSRTTMDIYTQAVSAEKRIASRRLVEMLMGDGKVVCAEDNRSVPLRTVEELIAT